MEKFQKWVQDPKNAPKVAIIFGSVLVVVIFVMLKQFGIIGGGGAAPMSPDMSGGAPGSAAPGTYPGAAPPPVPGAVAPAGPAVPGAAPAAAATPAAATAGPMLPYRKNPFLPFAGMPTQKDVMAVILPHLSRPRIAPAPVIEQTPEEQAAVVLPPQPFRRMAGVLWDGRVSAILETAGETDIVRPGMEINRGGSRVRVESITQDSITLKTLDTRTPDYIKVGMAGSVTGGAVTGKSDQGQDNGGPNMMQNGPY
jgi:hypothetical protein